AFNAGAPRQRIPLPTYPFERKRCWVDPPSPSPSLDRPALDADPKVRTASSPAETDLKVRSASSPAVVVQAFRPAVDTIDRWFWVPRWVPADETIGAAEFSALTDAVVFADESDVGRRFIEYLQTIGTTVTEVRRGSTFIRQGEHRFVVGDAPDDYRR